VFFIRLFIISDSTAQWPEYFDLTPGMLSGFAVSLRKRLGLAETVPAKAES
jgi:hypothetical protein